jgi:putative transposase
MDVDFCIDALRVSLTRYSAPEISILPKGRNLRRLGSPRFMEERQIRISMDGRERWLDVRPMRHIMKC